MRYCRGLFCDLSCLTYLSVVWRRELENTQTQFVDDIKLCVVLVDVLESRASSHRIIKVGRDLQDHPTTHLALPATVTPRPLNLSPDPDTIWTYMWNSDSVASMGNLFPCLSTITVKNVFLVYTLNIPYLSLRPFHLSSDCRHSRGDQPPPNNNLLAEKL